MNFYDRVTELCKERGESMAAVARKVGLSNSATTYWKRGSIPNSDTIKKLAEHFSVTTDYLLGYVNDPFFYLDDARIVREINVYSDDELIPENRIAVALTKLSEDGRRIAADRVEELTEIPRYQKSPQQPPQGPSPRDGETTPEDGESPPEGRTEPKDAPKQGGE